MINEVFTFSDKRIMAMNYSRYIALPKDWLRFKGLDAGDTVRITLTEEGDLEIKPVKGEDPQ